MRPLQVCGHIFNASPPKIKGHSEVRLLYKCPMATKKNPDQSVMHSWVKGHAGVIGGQPESNCWLKCSALIEKSCRDHAGITGVIQGSNCSELLYTYQSLQEDLLTGKENIAEVKVRVGVSQFQAEVKFSYKCCVAFTFDGNTWPECNASMESKIMQRSAGVNHG